ncbi:abortive infection family protein [Pseudofrancisella aestuarii]|uniref:Abortive infection family protein n=1 Tax=Pseudofrancisella aestuarii TaxID=2670347 RepID=A0ABV9TAU4_9GAMM|nr:abortive infection family protein [Pseudofrancisella aestuarii]
MDFFNDELENLNDFDSVEAFKNLLISLATGGDGFTDYKYLRKKILNISKVNKKLPQWVRTNRDSQQFWGFIKNKFGTYQERRNFLHSEFSEALDYLEFTLDSPVDEYVVFDVDYINEQWQKALNRKYEDPEGAITIARTLIETVLKTILEEQEIPYENKDLSELYKEVAKLLNLAPENHQERIFKQILGGANGIISGLGTLRNKISDSHGIGLARVKPKERHSELAVNIAGSMALFIYKTYKETK